MTDFLTRIRDIAMLLPGTAEQAGDGETRFLVEGAPFPCRLTRRSRSAS